MLQELAQYAQEHGLAAQAGFKEKALKAYICLDKQGEFLQILPREKGALPVYAPDIGSAANGTRYCNFLIEKAKIPLRLIDDPVKDRNIPTKFDFFLSMLESGSCAEPRFSAIHKALSRDDTRNTIAQEMTRARLKPTDPVGFMVDMLPMEQSEAYLSWWQEFRTIFAPEHTTSCTPCLISGLPTAPMSTVPKVTGLLSVGGHTSGDAFLCFDKDAFQSYCLKKSANAPVSEEAMTAVNAALTDLLRKAPVFGGAKMVHWYSKDVNELDIFGDLFEDMDWEIADSNSKEDERLALAESRQLLTSLDDGKRPPVPNARYYILPLSGAGGRMMVRGWYEGKFEDLYRNLSLWYGDLRIVTPLGGGSTKTPKLKGVCTRLLKPGGDPKKVFERMDSELSSLSGRVLEAIIHGNPLPDEVASRALRYIRSGMLSGDDNNKKEPSMETESMAFQILKAWLVRRQRQRGETQMEEHVNESSGSAAYHCGRLMAVYGEIHKAAMPDVNVSVTERYYASAITTPAFVLGKLSRMSVYHLAKLEQEKPGLAVYYRRHLDGIALKIDQNNLPGSLDLEEQTQFALGYYHQRAELHKMKD